MLMKYLDGLIDTDDWDGVDAIFFWGVWLALLYFGANQFSCAKSSSCGPLSLWFFGVVSVSLFPAAYFGMMPFQLVREFFKKKNRD